MSRLDVNYGVPSPPKIKLVTQHPTLPFQHRTLSQHSTLRLSTSDFTVVNIRVLNKHPTLQLPTLDFTVVNIGLLAQHPTVQLPTSNLTVVNIGLLAQHPTVQLSTSDYRLNIRLYSYRHWTLLRQPKKNVRLCQTPCSSL